MELAKEFLIVGKQWSAIRYISPKTFKSLVINNKTTEIFYIYKAAYKHDY
jgi:hypothetical protein